MYQLMSSVIKKVIRKKPVAQIEQALAALTFDDSDEEVQPVKAIKANKKPSSQNDEKQADDQVQGDCCICCQPYTKLRRKPTKCMFCPFEVCTECLQRYLLSQADAHCMECKKVFPKEYLNQHLSKAFVKDRLSHHYSDVLANLEKSLFPATMQELEVERMEAALKDNEDQVNEVMDLTARLTRTITGIKSTTSVTFRFKFLDLGHLCVSLHDSRSDQLVTEVKYLLENPNELFEEFTQRKENEDYSHDMKLFEYNVNYLPRMIYNSLSAEQPINLGEPIKTPVRYTIKQLTDIINLYKSILEEFLKQQFDINEANRKKIKKPIVVRCVVDKCPGYVSKCRLSDDDCTIAVCGICKGYSCHECLMKLDGPNVDHKCDQDLLKTIRLIARESKPCPSCKTPIQRTEGCPQMFCISCHTAFDWTTNQIVTGRIHNPHYFAWLEKLSDEEQKAESERRHTNNAPQIIVELDEYGCPIGNNHMFTSELFRQIAGYMNCFKTQDLLDAVGLRLRAIALAYQMFTHILEFNMAVDRVEPDPTLRYKQFRKDLLRGHKAGYHSRLSYTEAKWRQDLHASMVENERKHNTYQLYQATIAIAWNIYQQLEASFRSGFQGRPPNGYFGHQDSRFKACMPPVQEAYKQMLDLAKYYNEHARKLTLENGHTTYNKMIVPSPEVIDTKTRTDESGIKNLLFSMKVCKVSDNELSYKVDVKSISTLSSTTSSTTSSSTTTTTVSTDDEKVQFSPTEEKYIRLKIHIEELCKPILEFVDAVFKPQAFKDAANALQQLLAIPELVTFYEDIQAQIKACTAAKQRVDILKDTYKAIHATVFQAVSVFRKTVEVLLREFHWAFHKSELVHCYLPNTRRMHTELGVSRYKVALLSSKVTDVDGMIVVQVNKHLSVCKATELSHTDEYLVYKRYLQARQSEVTDVTSPTQDVFKQSQIVNCKVMYDEKKGRINITPYQLYLEDMYAVIDYADHKIKLPKWLGFISGFEHKKHTMFLDATLGLCARSLKSCPTIKLFDPLVFPCWIDGQEATPFEVILLPFLKLDSWTIQDLTAVHDRLHCVCGAINEREHTLKTFSSVQFKVESIANAFIDKILKMYLTGLISISIEPSIYLEVVNSLCGQPKDYNTYNIDSKTLRYFASNVWYLGMNCMLRKAKLDPDFTKNESTWTMP